MKKPKIRELGEAIRALIKGPYTLPFPQEPSLPPATFRGQMKWDKEVCVGCGACARVCPTGAIEVSDQPGGEQPHREMVRRYGMCIFCGQCHALCTTQTGCNHTTEYNLACVSRDASTENIKRELVRCEICGEAVATRDHLEWIYNKLGPLAFTNPTVLLGTGTESEFSLPPLAREATRADRLKILCPRCKRKVILADKP